MNNLTREEYNHLLAVLEDSCCRLENKLKEFKETETPIAFIEEYEDDLKLTNDILDKLVPEWNAKYYR